VGKGLTDKEALLLMRLEVARRTLQAGRVEEGVCPAFFWLIWALNFSFCCTYYSLRTYRQHTAPLILLVMRISMLFEHDGTAKEKLEASKSVLSDFAELDSSVNSAYYRVSALLQKTLGEAGEFYKCSLLYLAYTPLATLTAEEKQALAFDLGLAALCAEKLYQFGELLLHPILKCLE